MNHNQTIKRGLLIFCALLCPTFRGQGVLFYSTADPTHNTSAPTGALAGSGWQYQGDWGIYSGTPIGPHCFVTARHVGGAVGQVFQWNGQSFRTLQYFDDSASDLRIWQVRETFSAYAPLYTLSNEVGKQLVVIGRGTQRGAEVLVGGKVHGWQGGTIDALRRWGQNVVTAAVANQLGGDLLKAAFDANGIANEADLSYGDSGGAVFIQDGATWKLAGINYAVDGNYSTSPSGPGFAAALFDYGGLYTGQEGAWTFNVDLPTTQAGSFYATRVSVRASWIQSILARPLPPETVKLQIANSAQGPYQDDAGASVDTASGTIATAAPAGTAFFRVSGETAHRVTSIKKVSGQIQIGYQ